MSDDLGKSLGVVLILLGCGLAAAGYVGAGALERVEAQVAKVLDRQAAAPPRELSEVTLASIAGRVAEEAKRACAPAMDSPTGGGTRVAELEAEKRAMVLAREVAELQRALAYTHCVCRERKISGGCIAPKDKKQLDGGTRAAELVFAESAKEEQVNCGKLLGEPGQ